MSTTASANPSEPLYQAMIADGVDYRPWEGQGLGDDECFVCTKPLTAADRTVEDVISQWLRRDLARAGGTQKQHLELPNLTTMPVAQILLPACQPCNGQHLGKVESAVASAFRAGPAAVAALPESTLRIWFAKIAYGLRRHDMRLAADRRDPSSAKLATAADLAGFSNLHELLQEARGVIHVAAGHSTFLFFRSQAVGCGVCDFDLAVPAGWPSPVMLRAGEVTVIGAVDDRGALAALKADPVFQAAASLSLHPAQIRALWAILVHRASLLRSDRLPLKYGVTGSRLWIARQPPAGEVFDPSRERASVDKILQHLLDTSEEVLQAHGGANGLVIGPDGKPRSIPYQHGVLRLGIAEVEE